MADSSFSSCPTVYPKHCSGIAVMWYSYCSRKPRRATLVDAWVTPRLEVRRACRWPWRVGTAGEHYKHGAWLARGQIDARPQDSIALKSPACGHGDVASARSLLAILRSSAKTVIGAILGSSWPVSGSPTTKRSSPRSMNASLELFWAARVLRKWPLQVTDYLGSQPGFRSSVMILDT